ncbi:MAG: hypothetical protein AAFV53_39110 [Myxococcota bacterium]
MRTVRTGRKKKKKEEDSAAPVPETPRADTISDPLKAPETDPLRVVELQDSLAQQADDLAQADARVREPIIEEREVVEDIIEDLLDDTSMSDEEITPEDIAEDPLEIDEIQELLEIDENLGKLMNNLAELDALDEDSPIVEALIEDELEDAKDNSTTGFSAAFLRPEDMIEAEIQSQNRPMDDADTFPQVTPMSWVPNRVKTAIGRRALIEPKLEQGLSHDIKEDVSVRDEDRDIGTRSRRRYTPAIPTSDEVSAGLARSEAMGEKASIVTAVQTFHETMQANPDLGKTFILGTIRMVDRWLDLEENRIDIAKGDTPAEFIVEKLFPGIILDMKFMENFFDYDHDLIYYRQWASELERVRRKAMVLINETDRLRDQRDEEKAQEDLLASVPEGELIEWSMNNPDDAMGLYDDRNQHKPYTDRLMEEMFGDDGVKTFLKQIDLLSSPEALDPEVLKELEELDDLEDSPQMEQLELIRDALTDMDVARLEGMLNLPEMEDMQQTIHESMQALSGLDEMLRPILLTMLQKYGASGMDLETLVQESPKQMVLTVTRGADERPLPTAIERGPESGVHIERRTSMSNDLEQVEEEEDDGSAPDDDDDDDDEDDPEAQPAS